MRNVPSMEEFSNLSSSVSSINRILSKLKLRVNRNLFKYEEQPRQVNATEQEGHPCWGSLVLFLTVHINEDAGRLHSFRVLEKYGVRYDERITLSILSFRDIDKSDSF